MCSVWTRIRGSGTATCRPRTRRVWPAKAQGPALGLTTNGYFDSKDGKIEFSIDQQPYVQGYLAVEALYLNLKNGNDIGGGKPVLTGPSFVDSTNIDTIIPFAKNNTR